MKPVLAVRNRGYNPSEGEITGDHSSERRVKVAIWDVGASVADIDVILQRWNEVQDVFQFVQIFVSVPRQVFQAGQRTIEAAENLLGVAGAREIDGDLLNNLFTNSAMSIAKRIRKAERVRKIIMITPYMIADMEDGKFYANHFSNSEDGVIFISTFELRAFSKKAKRSFEVSVAYLILAQLLADHYVRVDFHPDTRNCLFDYNDDRKTIVGGLRTIAIDPICMKLIPTARRQGVLAMIETLKTYEAR